jgi:hypothetical protein
MAAGVAVWLVIDGIVERRIGGTQSEPPVWHALAALAAGIVIVVAPLLLGLIATAGFDPVWRALVVHPLTNYATANHCEWGHLDLLSAPQGTFTYPRVLKYLPLVFVALAPRLVVQGWRRDRVSVRRLLLLIAFCLSSVASIAYYPDFIHIAFIAPVFFVAIAESFEWLLSRLPLSRRLGGVGAFVVAAALVAFLGRQLHQNFIRLWQANPIVRQTAFGRIDLPMEVLGRLYDRVDALLRDVPSRQLFCYPTFHSLYLMADARNPTRYGFFFAAYNSPDQIREVLDVLRAERLPYIVVLAVPGFVRPDDPILAYVEREYEPLGGDSVDSVIFRRTAP